MLSRRRFLRDIAAIGGTVATTGLGAGLGVANDSSPIVGKAPPNLPPHPYSSDFVLRSQSWYMPSETAPHARTWMAFGASRYIWGNFLLPEVQRNIALIANTIIDFEPVTMLVRPEESLLARSLLDERVELMLCPLDDLWIRDSGPVFLLSEDQRLGAIDFNFNAWGNKQPHQFDRLVAGKVARKTDAQLQNTRLVLEGGGIEVDGAGTAIITESCVLNYNRNPGMTRTEFEALFMPLTGTGKVIWLPGARDQDITDGHTDFYARFIESGKVALHYNSDVLTKDHDLTLEHMRIINEATDVLGRPLSGFGMTAPTTWRETYSSEDYSTGYCGFYVCNGAVIAQEFGDPDADAVAKAQLEKAFPNRLVIQLNLDAIASGGGTVHCATLQQPALPA